MYGYKGRIYKVIKRFIHSNELMAIFKVEITRKKKEKIKKKSFATSFIEFPCWHESSNPFFTIAIVTCALLYIILASIINYLFHSPSSIAKKNFVFIIFSYLSLTLSLTLSSYITFFVQIKFTGLWNKEEKILKLDFWLKILIPWRWT